MIIRLLNIDNGTLSLFVILKILYLTSETIVEIPLQQTEAGSNILTLLWKSYDHVYSPPDTVVSSYHKHTSHLY